MFRENLKKAIILYIMLTFLLDIMLGKDNAERRIKKYIAKS